MWFVNGAEYDDHIRAHFLTLHHQAANGELDDWCQTSRHLLALVLLLDQFSRHIYRGSRNSFSQDEKAISIVLKGIKDRLDTELYYVQRKFLYMPLMHAEDISIQEKSIEMFTRLRDEVPIDLKPLYTKTLSFAQSHHYVISKFGRFPELNQMLGRISTQEEKEFLDTGKYRFL